MQIEPGGSSPHPGAQGGHVGGREPPVGAGGLPQDEYFALTRTDATIPNRLLKNFSNIPKDADGDLFGRIYEYFLTKFALAEGQGGGEFFTPRSVVRLMVEMTEPHGGSVFDPACGSGGMFVQSARFIEEHPRALNGNNGDLDLFVSGQEKTLVELHDFVPALRPGPPGMPDCRHPHTNEMVH